jgi:UDPglucose 6-dehydrogenase
LRFARGLEDAVNGAELVIVATEWREFKDADPVRLAEIAAGRVVIDGRNCLNAERWTSAGWVYRGLGRHAQ